ncbi:hypothetical protein [Halomonas daqiaonensis]|uniref:Aminoglycoside phosphotransferase family enzyme n=1 Tax=Halomonas daqiaonensis TaxID=650850 RepID=A0A1H7JGT9_9GAMM|nr:hypothetical protein [Halomonas daqiaonensis]SEK73809.1 Aminoglycoside phosphotransferase family enzyme [Halomonas daqiaonensis]
MAARPPDQPLRKRKDDQSAVLRFLHCPESYPEPTSDVELRETHLSCVFLTDEHVYKLKKPLRYDFLDFSTLEARRRNCETEVRLNSELAPSVYEGVVTLAEDPRDGLNLEGRGEPIEYLVKMWRLPDEWNLEACLDEDRVRARDVEKAARQLARFYAGQEARRRVEVDDMEVKVGEWLEELAVLPVDVDDEATALGDALREGLSSQRRQLARRFRRDVHGDLRPEHVYLGDALGDEPVFIDRLEFDPELRLMDPLEELSFFAMECQKRDAAWIGSQFLDAYREQTGDPAPDSLVGLYTAYRALLWAVLAARHLEREDHRKPWARITGDYLERGLRALRS